MIIEALEIMRAPGTLERDLWALSESIATFCLEENPDLWVPAIRQALSLPWERLPLVILLDTLTDYEVSSKSLTGALTPLLQREERTVFLSALYLLIYGGGLEHPDDVVVPENRDRLYRVVWDRVREEGFAWDDPYGILPSLNALKGSLMDEDEIQRHVEMIASACAQPSADRWVAITASALKQISQREHLITLLDAFMDYGVYTHSPEFKEALIGLLSSPYDTINHATLYVLFRCAGLETGDEARALMVGQSPERLAILEKVLTRLQK